MSGFTSVLFLPQNKFRMGEGGLRTKDDIKKKYKDEPLVSVATVVYNGVKYVEEAILSVLKQSYSNIEYIIVDGGSTDGTIDVLRKYEDQLDYWVSERDEGIYDAMNKCIRLSQGELIKLINADDLLKHDCIEKCVNIYKEIENKETVINGFLERIRSDGTVKAIWKNDGVIVKGYEEFNHPSWIVPKSVYLRYGLYSADYKISGDYEYYLRLKERGVDFMTIKEPIVSFRAGGLSYGLEGLREVLQINRSYTNVFEAYYDYFKRVVGKYLQKIKNNLLKYVLFMFKGKWV